MPVKFNIGDRVWAVKPVDGWPSLVGKYGTVVDISPNIPHIGVEFDEEFDGAHNCQGHCDGTRGRYGFADEFELVFETQDISPDATEISVLDNFLAEYQQKGA